MGDAERTLLLDLRARRGVIEAREAAMATREAVLAAAEKRMGERVEQLAALQARLEAMEGARHDREEANWRGLVKTYEAMRPRDAAAILNDLDMPVLLQVLDRMKEAKAAGILAAMLPDRARVRRRRSSRRCGPAPWRRPAWARPHHRRRHSPPQARRDEPPGAAGLCLVCSGPPGAPL